MSRKNGGPLSELECATETEHIDKWESCARQVYKLRLNRLVSCGVNLRMVVRILTRFGYKRRRHQTSA